MEFDSETGLYHTWFRQYDTAQGRWRRFLLVAARNARRRRVLRLP